MDEQLKKILIQLVDYVLETEESNYNEFLEENELDECDAHVYFLAKTLKESPLCQ